LLRTAHGFISLPDITVDATAECPGHRVAGRGFEGALEDQHRVGVFAEEERPGVTVDGEGDRKNLTKMLEMFEDNYDVQNVWHNWENPDD